MSSSSTTYKTAGSCEYTQMFQTVELDNAIKEMLEHMSSDFVVTLNLDGNSDEPYGFKAVIGGEGGPNMPKETYVVANDRAYCLTIQ